MKNLKGRGLALLLCACLVAVLFGVPAASGQESTDVLSTVERSEVLASGETLKTETRITANGDENVVTETLIASDGCSATITSRTTSFETVRAALPLVPAGEYTPRQEVQPAIRNLVTSVSQEVATLPCSPPLTEVLPAVVTPDLAFGGSTVDVPLVAAAAMIGVGGILVAVSKRRQDDDS